MEWNGIGSNEFRAPRLPALQNCSNNPGSASGLLKNYYSVLQFVATVYDASEAARFARGRSRSSRFIAAYNKQGFCVPGGNLRRDACFPPLRIVFRPFLPPFHLPRRLAPLHWPLAFSG